MFSTLFEPTLSAYQDNLNSNPNESQRVLEISAIQCAMKSVVKIGTAQKLASRGIIGAKTGTEKSFASLIAYDNDYLLYMTIKNEREEALSRIYLEQQVKGFSLMDLASSFFGEFRTAIRSLV
jgi:hypothetical protein